MSPLKHLFIISKDSLRSQFFVMSCLNPLYYDNIILCLPTSTA